MIRDTMYGKCFMMGGYLIGKFEDLTGKVFGNLTVLCRTQDYISPSGAHSVRWKCKCKCGTVLAVRDSHLKAGKSKSCGCNGGKFIDITGRKFGKLLVIKRAPNSAGGKTQYVCQCDCGNVVTVDSYNLRHGLANPCKCSQVVQRGKNSGTYKHGGSKTRLYGIWQGMLNRCRNPNVSRYNSYGGRGIKVCDEWLDFTAFQRWALMSGYAEDLTIDRINVNGDYCPENCRWANNATQANNRTTNHIVEIGGERHNLREWSDIVGINVGTIQSRIKRGWPDEKAVLEPVKQGGAV